MVREHISCLLCGSGDSRFCFARRGETYVECRRCGLVYVNPRPSREEIRTRYGEGYYEVEIKKVEFASRLQFFEEMAQRLESMIEVGRLLDVGCGYGHFLHLCRQRGWQTAGVELSGTACQVAQAQGLEVVQGSLEEAAYPAESFDVVTLWNVLNYMAEPLAEMRQVHRVLRRGGLVALRVPNAWFHLKAQRLIGGINQVLRTRLRDVSTFNVSGFSPRSIRFLLEEAGFTQVRLVNSPLSDINPWSIDRHYRAWLLSALKAGVNLAARMSAWLSLDRLHLAPSVETYARRSVQ
jgi:SAM-dependent methyltransferase